MPLICGGRAVFNGIMCTILPCIKNSSLPFCIYCTRKISLVHGTNSLRASYFSSTPTDKMYSVVSGAKALYDQLGDLGETSIDGDAFLDLWIYIIIKANIKDLVSYSSSTRTRASMCVCTLCMAIDTRIQWSPSKLDTINDRL